MVEKAHSKTSVCCIIGAVGRGALFVGNKGDRGDVVGGEYGGDFVTDSGTKVLGFKSSSKKILALKNQRGSDGAILQRQVAQQARILLKNICGNKYVLIRQHG